MVIWNYLVSIGLYRDLLATTIALTGARLIAWRPLKRHTRQQALIADRLDTTTPGGLGTVHQQLVDVHNHLEAGNK